MLQRICGLDLDNMVRFSEDFEHKGHSCLAFEMLDKNLHERLRERRGNPLSQSNPSPNRYVDLITLISSNGNMSSYISNTHQ